MRKSTSTVALLAIFIATASSAIAASTYVEIDQSSIISKLAGHISWTANDLSHAKKAESIVVADLEKDYKQLRVKGAVRVLRTFVKTPPPHEREWHTVIPSFRQWYLTGYDKAGKQIGKSALFPRDRANLAAHLVTFGPNGCHTKSNSEKPCKISVAKPEAYLNAALLTWTSANGFPGQGGDAQGYTYQLIDYCLRNSGTRPYRLTSTSLDCPVNAEITSDPAALSIPLVYQSSDLPRWGYKLIVDAKSNKAIMKLNAADFNTYIGTAELSGQTGVIRFNTFR